MTSGAEGEPLFGPPRYRWYDYAPAMEQDRVPAYYRCQCDDVMTAYMRETRSPEDADGQAPDAREFKDWHHTVFCPEGPNAKVWPDFRKLKTGEVPGAPGISFQQAGSLIGQKRRARELEQERYMWWKARLCNLEWLEETDNGKKPGSLPWVPWVRQRYPRVDQKVAARMPRWFDSLEDWMGERYPEARKRGETMEAWSFRCPGVAAHGGHGHL